MELPKYFKKNKFISPSISTREGMEYYQGDWRGLIENLIKQYPNDMELGREIRKLLNNK